MTQNKSENNLENSLDQDTQAEEINIKEGELIYDFSSPTDFPSSSALPIEANMVSPYSIDVELEKGSELDAYQQRQESLRAQADQIDMQASQWGGVSVPPEVAYYMGAIFEENPVSEEEAFINSIDPKEFIYFLFWEVGINLAT